MFMRVLRQAGYGLAFFIAGTVCASAGSFAVSPVRATLSSAAPVASLVVRNDDSTPVVVQLELAAWSQQDGKDKFTPTREILATPPIFTVPAHASQVVRVGLRRAPDAQSELDYRLFLQEVPPPPKPGFQGLRMALRISMPIFVAPAVAAAPALHWQAIRAPEGKIRIRLTNAGNAHVQVANFRLTLPGGADSSLQQVATYVLPGQSHDWLVAGTAMPGATVRLSAQTDVGDVQAEVVME
jgi:fimbrial chaperone protein